MHDAVTGELIGIPSLGVMTEQFASAAELMCRVLGAGDYPFAVVEHPISSATKGQLEEQARVVALALQKHVVRPT